MAVRYPHLCVILLDAFRCRHVGRVADGGQPQRHAARVYAGCTRTVACRSWTAPPSSRTWSSTAGRRAVVPPKCHCLRCNLLGLPPPKCHYLRCKLQKERSCTIREKARPFTRSSGANLVDGRYIISLCIYGTYKSVWSC